MSLRFESILNNIYEVAQCPVLLISSNGEIVFKKRPYGRVLTNHDNVGHDHVLNSSDELTQLSNANNDSSDDFARAKQSADACANTKSSSKSSIDASAGTDASFESSLDVELVAGAVANANINAEDGSGAGDDIDDHAELGSGAGDNIDDHAEVEAGAGADFVEYDEAHDDGAFDEISDAILLKEMELIRKFSVPVHLNQRKVYGGYCLPDDSILVIGPLERNSSPNKEYQLRITAVNALLDSFSFIAKRLVSSNQSVDTSFSSEIADVLDELKEIKEITPDWLDVVMVDRPHHSYSSELVKLDAVASGDPERYEEENAKGSDGINGTLAYTRFRDLQNLSICNVVLCSRAAISSGLSVEMAYTMADYLILTIERCRSEADVTFVSNKAGLIFARMVRSLKQDVSYKVSMRRLSRKAIETIKRHLYIKADRKMIASSLKVNEDYLDRTLKEDINATVSECLRIERIKEAKKLLISTETPILEIAQMLMFTSSSHFARVFKRHTGVSPKEYRDKKQNSNPYHL